MSAILEEQNGLVAVIELLTDMVCNYIAEEEKKAARRAELAWLDEIMLAEVEEMANYELTAELLGTYDYELVA